MRLVLDAGALVAIDRGDSLVGAILARPLLTSAAVVAQVCQTHTLDVVDAHVARLVSDGDHVLTSDPGDIAVLLDARRVKAVVTRV